MRHGKRLGFTVSCLVALAWPGPQLQPDDGYLRYTLTGVGVGDSLGSALAGVGDVNGDGFPDFAVGMPQRAAGHGVRSGKVLLVSGPTGEVIRTIESEETYYLYGSSLANVGDLDHDGVDDLVIGGPIFVERRSCRTGALLGTHYNRKDEYNTYAVLLAAIGDVDGDHVPDFTVQDGKPLPRHDDHFRFRVHSGQTGDILWERFGDTPEDNMGRSVIGLGDIDGDGRNDIVTGAPVSTVDGRTAGKVLALRGHDGAEIYTLTTGAEKDGFGISLVALPDLDADGIQEFAASAHGYPIHGVNSAGRVSLHSGKSGRLLWQRLGQDHNRSNLGAQFSGDRLGVTLASAGDADGDTYPDLLAYSDRFALAGQNWGRVTLLSGRTGAVLAAYESEEDHIVFGETLAGIGDIDGDGRSEFAVGAPEYDIVSLDARLGETRVYRAGKTYVFSYRPNERKFIRGDADADGDVDITDAVVIFLHLFAGGPAPCQEAMDINRAATGLNLTDPVHLVAYLFRSGWAPEPPFPDCAVFETTRDRLACERSSCER